ncbi:MAG: serine protein kinase RIO [Candidatus Woesearchaeota archaeon]
MVRKSRKSREEWKTYKNVFDQHVERLIFGLSSQGYFKDLVSPIALGKEANVFLALKEDGSKVIVKIYRLENKNFNNMFYYISSDPRFAGIENQKRKIVFSWVQREYRNLLLARERITVPTPLGFKDNILIMEYIGDDDPAPMLKDEFPEDGLDFFKQVIKNMKKLIDAGLIHGDLSDFNILNYNGKPVFIDMSQSTPLKTQNARELLERDLKNVFRAFKRHIKVDEDKITKEVMNYFDKKMNED